MAKNASKKGGREVNPRSRAAKRATSPGIDIDRTLKEAPRTTDATPILAAVRGGGISKKKKKTKAMTRGQRARQEKGLSRAEAVMDQMSKKVEEAKSRKKQVDQRRAGWEEINDATKEETRKAVRAPGRGAFEALQDGDGQVANDDTNMGVDNTVTTATDTAEIDGGTKQTVPVGDELDLIT